MTPKGERTRKHLMDVAMERFERDGFSSTSMRSIATDAGVAVGLVYRYFEAKESIVLAFYEDAARVLAQQRIDGKTLGTRFAAVMHAKFGLLAHRRRAIGSVVAAMMDPDGPVGLLSPATADLRATTQGVLREAVSGTPGLPPDAVEPLVRIAWLGHALLLLAWVQRPAAAEALVDRVGAALDLAVPFLGMPMAATALARTADALAAFSGEAA